ncbi:cytochrome P450 [Backusella circina FSU 941]|nr:cytochrome P450 [Backusella circina FSU 941]
MSLPDNTILKNAGIAAVTAASALTLLAIKYNDRPVFVQHLKQIPHHKGAPLVGNLIELLSNLNRQYDYFLELFERYDTLSLSAPSLGLENSILTIDPRNIEYVLKTNFKNFIKGPTSYVNLKDLLGRGIFSADGENWRWQRKTASHIFNVKNFRDQFTEVFVNEMNIMCSNVINSHVENHSPFDFHETIFKFTMDSFVFLGFGVQLGSLENEKKAPFAESFDYLQRLASRRFMDPFLSMGLLAQRIFKPWAMSSADHVKVVDEFAASVIKQRREDLANGIEYNDLLSRFMGTTNDKGERLNDTELRDTVLNFIIAGRDTTAQALSWLFYRLALSPRIEKKMLEEMGEKITDEIENDAPALYEVINGMTYFHAVFFETLRLYPSVPGNRKCAVEDDILPDGTPVPAGTYVAWLPYAEGRSTKIWGQDATEFKPERWLGEQGDLNRFSQGQWPAFHGGPRVCLGQNLATLEALVCVAMILKRYKFTLVPNQDVTYDISLTLPMKNGLKFFVEKR